MHSAKSTLLPYVLQTICQKPELCDTYENLCEEIKYILSTDDLTTATGNVQKHLEDALKVGQDLGILTINDDLIRVPFKLDKVSKGLTTSKKSKADDFEFFKRQPKRLNTTPPTIAHGRRKRGRSRSRRRRRRSRRSGRR